MANLRAQALQAREASSHLALLSTEAYTDKPLLYRLHSGEAFGDGGLVVAMFWALALLVLTVSGVLIFWRMRRRNVTGWRRYFF